MVSLNLVCNPGPTYISLEVIGCIIDSVIEREHHYAEKGEDIDASMLMDRGCGNPSVACAALWSTFETALHTALADYFSAHSPYCGREKAESDANEFMCADGPYAVFMSLNGEGVGVYDYWVHDHKLLSHEDCAALMSYLEYKLSHFANCSGSGSLNEIHEVCAYRDSED